MGWKRRLRKTVSAVLLPAFVLQTFLPGYALLAQPVAPPITIPQPQSSDFDPVFDNARGAANQSQWQSMVDLGYGTLKAAWEAQVLAQIQAEIAATPPSQDAFMTQAEYEDALRRSFQAQEDQARTDFERMAQDRIAREREAFLSGLLAGDVASVSTGALSEQTAALASEAEKAAYQELWNSIDQKKAQEYEAYQNSQKSALLDGFARYEAASGALERDRQTLLAEYGQVDLQYQANLAKLKEYESRVRNGIAQGVADMKTYLQTSGYFYEQTCVGTNCTTTLSTAGQELQALIATMENGLVSNAPLATLTTQMAAYLEQQEAYAAAKELEWQGRVRGQGTESASVVYAAGAFGALSTSAEIKAIRMFVGFGDRSFLDSLVSGVYAGSVIESIQEADFWAMDPGGFSYWPYPLTAGVRGQLERYSVARDAVFYYEACGVTGHAGVLLIHNCWTDWPDFDETKFGVSLKYTWYNATADANRATWQGYKGELDLNASRFRDVFAPAIGTWETAVADYQSKYDAWRTQAAAEVAAYNTAYGQSQEALLRSRNAWLGAFEEQKRKDDQAWQVFETQYQSRKDDFIARTRGQSEEQIKKEFHADVERFLAGVPAAVRMQPAVKEMLSTIRSNIGNIEASALKSIVPGLPDSEIINQLNDAFENAFQASMNAALMHEMNERSDEAREDFIGQVKKLAASLNGSVYQTMNMDKIAAELVAGDKTLKEDSAKLQTLVRERLKGKTDEGFEVIVNGDGSVTIKRMIPNGAAVLKAGGDPTNPDDYVAQMEQQVVRLTPPPNVKLSNGGELFEYWDKAGVWAQFEGNMEEYGKLANAQLAAMNAVITDANKSMNNAFNYFENARDVQVSIANQIIDLMKTMLTGGTFASWAQGQINSKIADTISAATGLPTGFISAILGGKKPHEAAKDFFQGAMLSELENVTGIQGLSQVLGQLIAKKKADDAAKKAKQQAMAQQLVTVAAMAAVPFTAGASAALAAASGMSTIAATAVVGMGMGVAQTALTGGSSPEAYLAGALGGMASAYTGGVLNFTYSEENGYGAALSYGDNLNNVALNYTENGGVSFDGKLSLGFAGGDLHYAEDTNWSGSAWGGLDIGVGHIGAVASYSQEDGWGGTIKAGIGTMARGLSVTYDIASGDVGAEARAKGLTVAYDGHDLTAKYTNGGLTLAYDGDGLSGSYTNGMLNAAYDDGRLTGSIGAITYNNGQWGMDTNSIRNMLAKAGTQYMNGLVNEYAGEFALPGQLNLGVNANGQITGSYALGGLTLGSNGKVSGSLGTDTPFGALGLNIQDGKIGAAMSGDYGNLGLDYANGQLGGSFNNGALGLGLHDGKWTGETNIGPINLDYGNGQWGGGMALGGSNVSYGNGGWSGTVEGNAVEQALGGAGVDSSGFEITDVSYNANEGWTGAFSNEFGTVNQDGQYSATVIPDDGDQSTTWPAVQEAATGVKTTISDIWTSIFGGEKPADGQQEVVENTGPQQPSGAGR